MKVRINGQDRELQQGTTILAVIHSHNLTEDKVAVELNRRLIRSANYNTELKDGDQLELVTFVGGG